MPRAESIHRLWPRVVWLSLRVVVLPAEARSTEMSDTNPAVPPHVEMIRMGTAYWLSTLVYTAAKVGLADHLAEGPKSAADLAGATGMNPRALHRFMRTLASFGVLMQNGDDTFALTELGATLGKDAPGAARSTVLTMAGPWAWQSFGEFEYSLATASRPWTRCSA